MAGLLAVTAVRACAAWSRHGLVAHDGTMAGARGGAARAWRALGVLGKDLLLLRRDRALLVQALIVPLFMIALQLVLNPQVGRSALSGFHAATTFAIALGGWVLMSAGQALAHEGQALWILGGAPRPLAALLRGKVAMWAGFACAYAACALAVTAIALPWPGASALSDIAMIAAGLPLLAVILLGALAVATRDLTQAIQGHDQRIVRLEATIGELASTTKDLSQSIQSLDRRMIRFETVVIVLVTGASIALGALQVFLR